MKSAAGLTLVEVLVALVVLVVGVLMAAMMQTTALRASSDAEVLQAITKLAEAEVDLRRQIDLTTVEGKKTDCLTRRVSTSPDVFNVPQGYACQVEVRSCRLVSGALTCPSGSVVAPVAEQVKITANGPRGKTITLTTVKAR